MRKRNKKDVIMFVDTHCHLNIVVKKKFDEPLSDNHYPEIEKIVNQARESGVEKIINVGTSIQESINSVEIAKRFDGVYATVGVHPCDSLTLGFKQLKNVIATFDKLLQEKELNKIVGVGEIGLDFYHKPFDQSMQIDYLKAHIELALKYQLPISFHVREAGDAFLRVLEEYIKDGVRGVIHCFQQNKSFSEVVLDWGLYVGIDAPLGYPKNQALRDVLRAIPLERIILETDAPFLPPQQFRGKGNYPAYIPLIAQMVADVKEVSVDTVERETTQAALALFRLE